MLSPDSQLVGKTSNLVYNSLNFIELQRYFGRIFFFLPSRDKPNFFVYFFIKKFCPFPELLDPIGLSVLADSVLAGQFPSQFARFSAKGRPRKECTGHLSSRFAKPADHRLSKYRRIPTGRPWAQERKHWLNVCRRRRRTCLYRFSAETKKGRTPNGIRPELI